MFSPEDSRLIGQRLQIGHVKDHELLIDCRAAVIREEQKEGSSITALPEWCKAALGL